VYLAAHEGDWFLDECTYRNICVIVLPPHSSDQTQPLDLGIFHIAKTGQERIRTFPQLNEQSKQLIKLLSGWQSATTPVNITSAFRQAGILTRLNNETMIIHIDPEYAIKVRHQKVADNMLPNPTLSKQRIYI
jgi:hypothetical protein